MKILITGSNGVIGNVLKQGLPHDITHYDLPDFDVHDYPQLVSRAKGHDAIVHLAWDTATDNWKSDYLNPNNALKTANIYRAAVEAGVRRVIMASSVHADKFEGRTIDGLLKPYDLPLPDSPYGAGKVLMESLGRYYSDAKDLGVVCVRFGAVNRANVAPEAPESERQVWLSHRDCSALITSYLEAPSIPNNFEIVYGVSDNAGRIHDIQNSVGWQPQDGAQPLVHRPKQ
ncbi:MAG TPA: NAD(P)-dependent oxidoreductase [Candidatus Saccharimonadales bacterium]|nr:NAD(P)-dependent oxidoreductase [Candidatus Saccharimonadales bacterium]